MHYNKGYQAMESTTKWCKDRRQDHNILEEGQGILQGPSDIRNFKYNACTKMLFSLCLDQN